MSQDSLKPDEVLSRAVNAARAAEDSAAASSREAMDAARRASAAAAEYEEVGRRSS